MGQLLTLKMARTPRIDRHLTDVRALLREGLDAHAIADRLAMDHHQLLTYITRVAFGI